MFTKSNIAKLSRSVIIAKATAWTWCIVSIVHAVQLFVILINFTEFLQLYGTLIVRSEACKSSHIATAN